MFANKFRWARLALVGVVWAPVAASASSAPELRASALPASALGPRAPQDRPPREDTLQGELDLALADLVTSLAELAEWCGKQKLYLQRNAIWETVLELDPEHEDAHLALKHKRQRDGSWKPSDSTRVVKDLAPKKLPEALERRAAVASEFADRALAVLEFYADRATDADAERVYDLVLGIDPDHARVRELRGEARLDDAWVLADTLAAKERRGKLRDLVRAAMDRAPEPRRFEPTGADAARGVRWTTSIGTPKVRVLSTLSRDEATRVARVTHATTLVFRSVFDSELDVLDGYTVFLIGTDEQRDAWLASWDGWTESDRDFRRTLAGCGVPKDIHVARWDESPPARIDGVQRHTLGVLLRLNYGFDVDVAWAFEGFGLYLTRAMVGTRLTWYCSAPPGDGSVDQIRGRLIAADVNWMNEGYQLLKSGKGPSLAGLLELPINRMSVADMLAAYVFGAYLLEARHGDVPAILRRIRDGETSVQAVTGVLGMELPTLEARLVRWLSERR